MGKKDLKKLKLSSGRSDVKSEPAKEISNIMIIQSWEMPDELKEISAISYLDEQRFICVQDEIGKIFVYNTGTQKIERQVPFAESGDYEGLALNGETVYVLRADGQIIEVKDFKGKNPIVRFHKTFLTTKQDTEGLAFDKENNRLLISVKGKDQNKDYKSIYA